MIKLALGQEIKYFIGRMMNYLLKGLRMVTNDMVIGFDCEKIRENFKKQIRLDNANAKSGNIAWWYEDYIGELHLAWMDTIHLSNSCKPLGSYIFLKYQSKPNKDYSFDGCYKRVFEDMIIKSALGHD